MGRGQVRTRRSGLQRMGGKEERTSEIGRARARIERREAEGTGELLSGRRRSRRRK